MNCIIIDDETAARSRLARMLASHPSVQVIGEASDGLQALERIEALHPDLIFLDIQMPGLNGFEVLRSMPKDVPYPLVVFVTGFDAHALEAFEANALAYLLKPVETERLAGVIERAAKICEYERLREQERERTAKIVQGDIQPLSQIVARKRDRFVLLSPGEVLYFSAEDGVIKAKTASETYLVNYQLADLETGLPSATFSEPAARYW
ncbi:MAG TPA: response regulator transcription factor [Bryobacteraceae bacterium]|nr:response regulator transcription factor [Bryobacteraceae bacterium]